MVDTQNTQKALEVKIRTLPGQERQDQKDVSRVFLSKDTLLDLRLEAGQLCYLWKIEDDVAQRREAVAWPSSQKLNKNVVQMFKTFQEVCGFKLEDRIAVAPSEVLQPTSCVVLRDITAGPGLSEQDRSHWEWFLEDKLGRTEFIFHGLRFDISLKGPKRSFIVESFISPDGPLHRFISHFGDRSRVKIMDEHSISTSQVDDGLILPLQIPNIAGIEQAIAKLNDFLAAFEGEQADELSWGKRSHGVILHGTQGTGKSLVLDKVSKTGWGNALHVDVQMKSSAIRDVFKDAKQLKRSIIVIDEMDLVVSMEQRSLDIEKVLGEEMDKLCIANSSKVVVIAAASSLNDIPRSMRKRGRFTTDILLPVPNADARKRILRSLAPTDSSDEQLDLLDRLGERTHAYTGEDLGLLLDKACEMARRRSRVARFEGSDTDTNLLQEDVNEALLFVRPTAMHDVTLQPPKVRWGEIGGQHNIKKALRRAVETPLLYPDLIKRLGATAKKGLLLYGPPGCSKTLSAQAMATEIGFNFFAVKGAELLNMYVGESERAVRDIFSRARAASPSIIFFDEIESIGGARSSPGSSRASSSGGVNVLTTLLTEMDGIETLTGVTILAATNKPEMLDPALLRPGRFDDLLYVAPPDLQGREEILRVRQRKMDWDDDVDIPHLAQLMEGYSGAEIVGVCQVACDAVIDRALNTGDMEVKVRMQDFVTAVGEVKKQITPGMVEGYRRWAAGMRGLSG